MKCMRSVYNKYYRKIQYSASHRRGCTVKGEVPWAVSCAHGRICVLSAGGEGVAGETTDDDATHVRKSISFHSWLTCCKKTAVIDEIMYIHVSNLIHDNHPYSSEATYVRILLCTISNS